MKKKTLTILTVVSAILAVGVTLAMMVRRTSGMENQFKPAEVKCSVVEAFDGEKKTSVKIKNDSNIPCYLRLRFVSYWVNSDGEIIGKTSEMPEIPYDDTKWKKDEANDTYYYLSPVEPEAETEELLKAGESIILKKEPIQPVKEGETPKPENMAYQVVEVFAEAVQAEPEKAIVEAWRVQPPDMTPAAEH